MAEDWQHATRVVRPGPIALSEGTWRERARCIGADGDLFYPGKGDSGGGAKWYCDRCPVRAECLQTALTNREEHGVWGGLTAWQRRAITQADARRARRDATVTTAVRNALAGQRDALRWLYPNEQTAALTRLHDHLGTAEAVADAVGMSERTVQRRLRAARTAGGAS